LGSLARADLQARQVGIGEIHGLPLRYWQTVADRTKELAAGLGGADDGQPGAVRDVVVVTGIQDDGARHLDRRRKALDYLLGPELEARFPLEGLTVVPTDGDSLLLTIPEQEPPSGARRLAPLGEVPLPGTDGATRFWLASARPPRELVPSRFRVEAPFETGIRLLGADIPSSATPGQTVPLTTFWLVERQTPPEDEDDEPFVELLDAGGRSLAYTARGGLPSQLWRSGDLLIQRASLTLPTRLTPGDYPIMVGLVSRRDGSRAHLIDAAGRPIGDAASAGLVEVQRP
jgi:hypothetical protein